MVLQRSGCLIGVVALATVLLAFEAMAQPRGQQPPRPPQPLPPPTGHQTEPVDLNEGKSAAELFQAGCAVCHQSAAGLAKGRRESELVGFLRQHYTSSVQHASVLAGFLMSGGRSGPAVAAPSRQPPAGVSRRDEDRKPQEAARPGEREPAAKRKPPAAAPAARTPPAATAAAPVPEPTAETGASAVAPPPEEKPAPPEIPL
jgi:hypothetical protein